MVTSIQSACAERSTQQVVRVCVLKEGKMAKFVVAGKVDCAAYARAELLADQLQSCLPDFHVHKVSLQCKFPSAVAYIERCRWRCRVRSGPSG